MDSLSSADPQTAVSRKQRPYLFYDTTSAICSTCMRVVEAKILFKDERVWMDKWCPVHGVERVLIADDVAWYKLCREVYVKAPEMPANFSSRMQYGCPYDCGLCPDHMQHSCLTVLEVTDQCNLNCPVCYAESGTARETQKSLEQVIAMLDAVVKNEGEPDVVQISGGEPTLHPDFFAILDAAKARPIKHLMINTNGIKIAQDAEFAQRLAGYAPGVEIYLQFDSLREEVLKELRGADLRRIRHQALQRLNELNLSTTLVVTLKKGLNDDEIGDLIEFALQQRCVRGITLQPISVAGRVEDFTNAKNRLTVSEIRRKIGEQSAHFSVDDVLPVPCNPDTLAMAYGVKLDGKLHALTRFLDAPTLLSGEQSTIVFERDPQLKQAIFKLFATNHSPQNQAQCLSELLCCLPKLASQEKLGYENVFRILIVQFMDAHNLDIRALKKSCVHMVQADGSMIPFEAFNLFYRDQKRELLAEIRQELGQMHAARKAPPTPSGLPGIMLRTE